MTSANAKPRSSTRCSIPTRWTRSEERHATQTRPLGLCASGELLASVGRPRPEECSRGDAAERDAPGENGGRGAGGGGAEAHADEAPGAERDARERNSRARR